MTLHRAIEPLPPDDEAIRQALEDAHLRSLLPTLAQITGDPSVLRDDLRPTPRGALDLQGELPEADLAAARELALRTLVAWRDAGSVVAEPPSPAAARRMIDYLLGEPVSDDVPAAAARGAGLRRRGRAGAPLAQGGDRRRAVAARDRHRRGDVGRPRGAAAAAGGHPLHGRREKRRRRRHLAREHVPRGARVDTPNHLYSYACAQKLDWPYHFSPQETLLEYFRDCATEFGVREDIRFHTEVLRAAYDEARGLWRVDVRGPDGVEETLEAEAVISAVGQLNRPKLPDVAGLGAFAGPTFHSAEWDHAIDFAGKTVGVIGTGASASQFIPHLADWAGAVRIFQRTPNWYVPVPHYHDRLPDGLLWLLRHVPAYAQWYRFWLFWAIAEGFLPMTEVDDGWRPGDVVTGEGNRRLRALLAGAMREHLAGRPDLIEKTIPDYPPASKRIVLDNGVWPGTLRREHVQLITDPIDRITPRGVRTESGEEHDLDVLIYGTGFQASRFLTPMQVLGRGGADMHKQWGGDARAYLGVTMPNFPNFFFLYGPNTNLVVNGSIIYFSECEVQYVLECLRFLLESGRQAIDCRRDVHDAYNVRIDAGNLKRAWGVSNVPSWYKSASGRVAQNWPFSLLEFWQQTQRMDPPTTS